VAKDWRSTRHVAGLSIAAAHRAHEDALDGANLEVVVTLASRGWRLRSAPVALRLSGASSGPATRR